jgi:hypothetical protein
VEYVNDCVVPASADNGVTVATMANATRIANESFNDRNILQPSDTTRTARPAAVSYRKVRCGPIGILAIRVCSPGGVGSASNLGYGGTNGTTRGSNSAEHECQSAATCRLSGRQGCRAGLWIRRRADQCRDRALRHARFPGVRLKPLIHVSGGVILPYGSSGLEPQLEGATATLWRLECCRLAEYFLENLDSLFHILPPVPDLALSRVWNLHDADGAVGAKQWA